ncbi:MAG: amino acid permease, partial [Hydrogenovibrio sp.]|nr:amino acid permease [Hydrogenovibrio sp.]
VMAARLFYGMAARGWLPQKLSIVHPLTRTPVNSTLLTVGLMIFFALALPMVTLAELTSYLVLLVFTLVNLALVRIKHRLPNPPVVTVFPIWLPWLGFLTTGTFLLFQLVSVLSS